MKGYNLGTNAAGERFIACATCGARSYNPNDIAHRYCGRCHAYLDTEVDELNLDGERRLHRLGGRHITAEELQAEYELQRARARKDDHG